jgi:DNA-binding transcriptional LysR family regulator
VTQGAVSHQVKALEIELGLQLFRRERNGLVITEAGRDYLAVVRDVFDQLELATDRLLQRQRSGTITVSTSPDFAAKWLVIRLGRFADLLGLRNRRHRMSGSAHPSVTARCAPRAERQRPTGLARHRRGIRTNPV